jgi:hypothetical protein
MIKLCILGLLRFPLKPFPWDFLSLVSSSEIKGESKQAKENLRNREEIGAATQPKTYGNQKKNIQEKGKNPRKEIEGNLRTLKET